MELTPNGSMPSTTVFLDSVHPDDRAQVATALQSARGELGPFTLSHRVIVPDTDQERFVRHRADIQRTGALPHRYMGAVHDVTDQVRVEAAMQQARAAAEEADRAKSSLLSMASHDMRTPLTAIQGYLETVLSGSLGPVPDEQREDPDGERDAKNQHPPTGDDAKVVDQSGLRGHHQRCRGTAFVAARWSARSK